MPFNTQKYKEINSLITNKYRKNTIIVAISKNHPLESVNEAIFAGVRIFGENRVKEAFDKFYNLKKEKKDIELHLTGPLQTNKVKKALEIFDVIQTLDREKLANELNKHQDVIKNKIFFIQVNIGKEKTKSGILPEDTCGFVDYCRHDLNINISGLMCIPPNDQNPEKYFLEMKKIASEKKVSLLSMGMSNDYEYAIKAGADYIRIGTALFGERKS